MKRTLTLVLATATLLSWRAAGQGLANLPDLSVGPIAAANALWVENDASKRFTSSKRVVVADLQGPARIEMMHFAMPGTLKLGRDVALEIYWDGEKTPSVDCPLVDFFCDPAGKFDSVNTAMVNVRRGFNCYFPMPFRKSARVVLAYDGPMKPSEELAGRMPCYSYVMYRKLKSIPKDQGYFHAAWRQRTVLLGVNGYPALNAKGTGKFVGWNITIRTPGRTAYPVDENEMFFVDGDPNPVVEFQGLEDSFGFSWGFPPTDNQFPLTGYRKFMDGASAYRFFLSDAITFKKSLKVIIDFGRHGEKKAFLKMFGGKGLWTQMSSTVYWYQTEPHAPLPALPSAAGRVPAPTDNPVWPHKEKLPKKAQLKARGVKLEVFCGRKQGEVIYAAPGFGLAHTEGIAWEGFPAPVYYCRGANKRLHLALSVPRHAEGTLRIYVIDADSFMGGRKERILVDGKKVADVQNFQKGRWIETPVSAEMTQDGKVDVVAQNLRRQSNAVISILEWVGRK